MAFTFTAVKEWFVKQLGPVGDAVVVLFKAAYKEELEKILPIAKEAVAQVAADPTIVTSPMKRSAALAIIAAKVGDATIQVGGHLVANIALELAVANLAKKA